MITAAINLPATNRTTLDDHAVRCRLRVDTKRVQTIGHDLDTIAFLDPQLFGAGQYRAAFSAGSSNKQRREFINRQRHLFNRYLNPF